MELIGQNGRNIVICLKPKEVNLILLALMFSGVPTKGGISKEGKDEIFEGSRGVYAIRNSIDPRGKERVERNKREREEARKRGEKWVRKGMGIVEPVSVRLT